MGNFYRLNVINCIMMPFSYQGFGFAAILLMVAILSAAQLLKYLAAKYDRHQDRSIEK
jgi:hypothetical protein